MPDIEEPTPTLPAKAAPAGAIADGGEDGDAASLSALSHLGLDIFEKLQVGGFEFEFDSLMRGRE